MATVSRAEALTTLAEGQAELDRLVGGMSNGALARRATIGGGDWSAKDLIGHIASWETLALEHIENARAGRPAGNPFGPGGVDQRNAENIARMAARSLAEVRRSAAETHRRLVAAIETLGDEAWASLVTLANGKRSRLWRLLGGTLGSPSGLFGHAFAHLPDLRAYAATL